MRVRHLLAVGFAAAALLGAPMIAGPHLLPQAAADSIGGVCDEGYELAGMLAAGGKIWGVCDVDGEIYLVEWLP